MLEKVVEIGLLFDFYGEILTAKQQEAILLYYYDDLSLGEIAERLGISRQAVYDHLHRGEDILREYEKKLGLVAKYRRLKEEIDDLARYIDKHQLENEIKKGILERVERIKKHL